MKKYPFLLKPIPKQTIWGGTNLKAKYHKEAPFEKIAESWELSVRNGAVSMICNGQLSGVYLDDIINESPSEILGTNICHFERFPILIKFIDAADDLSIQVHPDNDYALSNENDMGKTEMWVIIDAEPNARLIYGLKKNYSLDEFKKAVNDERTEEMLHSVHVSPGEVYFIPAGQVHAIGKGILLAEIQQNSDTTYRLYDYNRRQSDGTLRELHIDKALDVIVTRDEQEINELRYIKKDNIPSDGELLCSFTDFSVRRFCSSTDNPVEFVVSRESFASIIVIDANDARLSSCDTTVTLHAGDSYLIPADTRECYVHGDAKILVTTIN